MLQCILKLREGVFAVHLILTGLCLIATDIPIQSQTNSQMPIRLFRLEGTFSEEIAAKISRDNKGEQNSGFNLSQARLEADSLGSLTRIRTILNIVNVDPTRRITEVEWRLDIFDAQLRSASASVAQIEKINIYAGETGSPSAKFAAVLPDKMIVLLQVSRVTFADGSVWSAAENCSLASDFKSVSCTSK